jgi:exopolysaccharide production protein ExoQ
MQETNQFASASQPASSAERCFNVLFLVLLTGAFVNLFLTPEQILDPGGGMAGARFMWAAIYAGVLFFWLRYCRGSLKLLLSERAILLLVALAIVSVIWSDSPATTFRRSFALVGTCLIALYFAARFRVREQLQLLACAFGICVACSLVFGWFHWGISVDNLEGAWYGIYTQRNVLGSMMALSVLMFLLWAQIHPGTRWMSWIFAAASFVLIALSGSITSLIAFSVLLLSFPMIRLLRSSKRAGAVIFIFAILVAGLAWWAGASLDTTAEAVGRDSSLTGRTQLWGASVLIGLERPWLGFGYNAFWLGTEGQSADVWKIVGWAAPSAHNGLLEIWLDLGAVGVAIAVFSLGSCLRKAFHLIRGTRAWEYAWPLLFLVVLIVLNLTESAFFEGNSIYSFLYIVVALDLSQLMSVKERNQRMRIVD